MELGSSIVGAILIALCILPLIMMSRSRKKREEFMMQSLSRIATENNCTISQHELCTNFAIGLDNAKPALIFYKKTKENTYEQFVDLSQVQSCKVYNASRSFPNKGGTQKVIDKLELGLIPLDRTKPEIRLEFFNAAVSPQLFSELQAIQTWAKRVTASLRK